MAGIRPPKSISTLVEQKLFSIIIPAFNEQEVILEFYQRLSDVHNNTDFKNIEIIYINDGSTDETHKTLTLLLNFREQHARIKAIDLTRKEKQRR